MKQTAVKKAAFAVRAAALALATALAGATARAANPTIEINSLLAHYPWDNTVDITYSVSSYTADKTYNHFVVFQAKDSTGKVVGAVTNDITANGSNLSAKWSAPTMTGAAAITPLVYRKRTSARYRYVQSGLVAMWDGTENAGEGTHNGSATTWVDIISGWNGTLGANTSWAADSLVVSGDGQPCTVPANISQVIATKNFTIEVSVKPSRNNVRCTLFGNYNVGTAQDFNFEAYSGNWIRTFYSGDPDIGSDSGLYQANVGQTFANTTTPSKQQMYKNGASIYSRDGTIGASLTAGTTTVLAGETARASMAARGNFYCFRIYNRALTAAELKQNYDVDKDRFGW